MAIRRPLVLVSGLKRVLPTADTLYQNPIKTVNVTANFTITDEDFVRGSGTSAFTVKLPDAGTATKPVTVKHVGTQDMTIEPLIGGQQIDSAANILLRGNKKNAVTFYPEGGNWWIA